MAAAPELLNLETYKAEVHRILISKLDLEKLSRVESNQARQVVASLIGDIIRNQGVPLSFEEQAKIQGDLLVSRSACVQRHAGGRQLGQPTLDRGMDVLICVGKFELLVAELPAYLLKALLDLGKLGGR